MFQLNFVTSSNFKFREISDHIKYDLCQVNCFDLDEIQALDVNEVAREKCLQAYRYVAQPVLVDDTGLYISDLCGFPGALVTWMIRSLGIERMAAMSGGSKATLRSCLAYTDGCGQVSLFEGTVEGSIALNARGSNGFGFDPIFIPSQTDRTLAEMDACDKQAHNPRSLAAQQLNAFLRKTSPAHS